MRKSDANKLGLGLFLMLAGVTLASDPRCKCGCKTLAEHLFKAGLDLLGGQST